MMLRMAIVVLVGTAIAGLAETVLAQTSRTSNTLPLRDKEVDQAANFIGGWAMGSRGARPTLDNRYWTTDSRGNIKPTLNNRYWTTDAQGRLRPTAQNRYWSVDSRGNVRPTANNPYWRVDASGKAVPTLKNRAWSSGGGQPLPTLRGR